MYNEILDVNYTELARRKGENRGLESPQGVAREDGVSFANDGASQRKGRVFAGAIGVIKRETQLNGQSVVSVEDERVVLAVAPRSKYEEKRKEKGRGVW